MPISGDVQGAPGGTSGTAGAERPEGHSKPHPCCAQQLNVGKEKERGDVRGYGVGIAT